MAFQPVEICDSPYGIPTVFTGTPATRERRSVSTRGNEQDAALARSRFKGRVDAIRAAWSNAERARRAAQACRQTRRLAVLLGMDIEEPEILAVGAPCSEDLRRMQS